MLKQKWIIRLHNCKNGKDFIDSILFGVKPSNKDIEDGIKAYQAEYAEILSVFAL